MNMKRLIWAALLAAMVLGLLASCGQNQSADARIYREQSASDPLSAKTVSVSFLGYKADAMNLIAIENAIHGFMSENPGIEIVYEGIKGTPYLEAFRLRAEKGTLDDLFMIHHDEYLTLAPQGQLVDLSDLSCIDSFNTLARSQVTEQDGSIYTLPTSITAFGMYVNLDMLKENGFEAPTNWVEFSRQCDYFAQQGITPIIGNNFTTLYTLISAKGLYSIYQTDNTTEMIEQFNSGQADIAPYLADGVELVGTMLERGWFDVEELKVTNQTSDDLALFAQGGRPFMITGGWASPRLMALGPQFQYAIYPYPVLEDDSVLVLNITTCLSVNADSDHQEEAKQFVEYLAQPDVIYEYCDAQSCFTPLLDDRLPSDRTVEPTAQCLLHGVCMIGSDFRLKLPIDDVDRTVGEAMLDGMSTQDAVTLLRQLLSERTFPSDPELQLELY